MRPAIALVLIFAASSASTAPADCIRIESDLDRLACYDREAGRTPNAERIPPAAGTWTVRRETSRLTDQPTVMMSVRSKETVNCGWNNGARIDLVLRCHENTTALYFATGCHMTSSDYNDYGDIEYRIDGEKARTVSARESTDNRALGLWNGGRSIPVIKQMLDGSQMIVRMTPYGESPFTATFEISGLSQTIVPLCEACGW